jgi:hypothetical protein
MGRVRCPGSNSPAGHDTSPPFAVVRTLLRSLVHCVGHCQLWHRVLASFGMLWFYKLGIIGLHVQRVRDYLELWPHCEMRWRGGGKDHQFGCGMRVLPSLTARLKSYDRINSEISRPMYRDGTMPWLQTSPQFAVARTTMLKFWNSDRTFNFRSE